MFEELQQSSPQLQREQAEEYYQWTKDMQTLEHELKKKKCPYCQKGNGLRAMGLNEFMCTKCDNTGFTRGLFK